jgi:hypothetical protein
MQAAEGDMLKLFDHTLVAVHGFGDWHNMAAVDVTALFDLRYQEPQRSDAVLHAYVASAHIVSGELPAPAAADGHEKILVCVRQSYDTTASFARLMKRTEGDTTSPPSSQLL